MDDLARRNGRSARTARSTTSSECLKRPERKLKSAELSGRVAPRPSEAAQDEETEASDSEESPMQVDEVMGGGSRSNAADIR